jgi:hypothetical protein
MFFPDPRTATSGAQELADHGYDLGAPESEDGSWRVTLQATMLVNEDSIAELNHRLECIANAHGGKYDGWEASPTP